MKGINIISLLKKNANFPSNESEPHKTQIRLCKGRERKSPAGLVLLLNRTYPRLKKPLFNNKNKGRGLPIFQWSTSWFEGFTQKKMHNNNIFPLHLCIF